MDQSALSFENFFVYYFIINKKYIGIKKKERKKERKITFGQTKNMIQTRRPETRNIMSWLCSNGQKYSHIYTTVQRFWVGKIFIMHVFEISFILIKAAFI